MVLLHSDDPYPAFHASQMGTSTITPLLPVLVIMKENFYPYGKVRNGPLARRLFQILTKEKATSGTASNLTDALSHYYHGMLQSLDQGELPDLATLAKYIVGLRSESGEASNLGYVYV